MKKLLIFMLVLGLASVANGTYVVVYNAGATDVDIMTDSAGGPWQDYFMIVCPTVEALIGWGSVPSSPPLDASSVFPSPDKASDYVTVPSGQDGPIGYIGSYGLTPPFTGVTDVVILEDFAITWQGSYTQTIVSLYRIDETTYATTFDGSYLIPEPMTIVLLGLGGLFLRRRK